VKGDIVEDHRLAQILCGSGKRLAVRGAEAVFATRMYRSLNELIAGWSKNLSVAARQAVPSWAAPIALPTAILVSVAIWISPPVALFLSLVGGTPSTWWIWSTSITGFSVLMWSLAAWRLQAPLWTGLFYPLAAGVVNYTFLRSWPRGGHVEWKGREYRV
jgi:hypothetical protein